MTNDSPITMSNFVAGTIGVGIAIIVMPQIIIGTVGAQQAGVARTATNDLIEDINNVCGNTGEESGSLDMKSGYEIVVNYRDYELKNPDGEVIEERTMACKVDEQTTISSSGDYIISTVERDDNPDLYDFEWEDS